MKALAKLKKETGIWMVTDAPVSGAGPQRFAD